MLNSNNPYAVMYVLGGATVLIIGFWAFAHLSTNTHALQEQQQIWETTKPDNYRYTVIRGCMMVTKTNVIVKKGEVTIIHQIEKGTANNVLITDAFVHAQKSIQSAYRTNIEYHWQYGFPNLISSDWNADTIDDECFYQIENFEVIK